MSIAKEAEPLFSVVMNADDADLCVLADYVTDRGKGRLALDGEACKALVASRTAGKFETPARELLASEILQFGGNTLSNLYRSARQAVGSGSLLDKILPSAGATISYEEIVRDVASRMKVAVKKEDGVEELEGAIIRKVLEEALAKMDDAEKGQVMSEISGKDYSALNSGVTLATIAAGSLGGFATYRMAVIVANAVARTLTGTGLRFASNAALTRTLGVVLGPVGWVVTGLWTLADLASPAYRVTVPCVIQIAYMRQKARGEAITGEASA